MWEPPYLSQRLCIHNHKTTTSAPKSEGTVAAPRPHTRENIPSRQTQQPQLLEHVRFQLFHPSWGAKPMPWLEHGSRREEPRCKQPTQPHAATHIVVTQRRDSKGRNRYDGHKNAGGGAHGYGRGDTLAAGFHVARWSNVA